MKKQMMTYLLLTLLLFAPMSQLHAGPEPYLAEVTLFAGNFAPRGYAFCEGQILQIDQNSALFSLLGTRYGGDGRTTFALPDMQTAEAGLNGVRYIIATEGRFPSRY